MCRSHLLSYGLRKEESDLLQNPNKMFLNLKHIYAPFAFVVLLLKQVF